MNKKTLYEALEKIKSELMLLGFISLLLIVGQGTITNTCIPKSLGDNWLPCSKKDIEERDAHLDENEAEIHRKLLSFFDSNVTITRRVLSGASSGDKCQAQVTTFEEEISTNNLSWISLLVRSRSSFSKIGCFCRVRFHFYQVKPSTNSMYLYFRWPSFM